MGEAEITTWGGAVPGMEHAEPMESAPPTGRFDPFFASKAQRALLEASGAEHIGGLFWRVGGAALGKIQEGVRFGSGPVDWEELYPSTYLWWDQGEGGGRVVLCYVGGA